MTSMTDTIMARASGAGPAAVAVLRLSGPQASTVLEALAGGLPEPRRASLRRLRGADGDVLDEALVLWFPGPGSYTGEDAAELHLHGGTAIVAAVEAALLAKGCRPAEPGEFTRRAFLHGRMDLTQAEGIADLIAAETESQRRQALRQAGGALATLYDGWTQRLTRILAQQEAAIEFEMDNLPSDVAARAREAAASLCAEIIAHLSDGNRGERLREGLSIAILGAPNAGKSSLMNALAGRDAVIVSPEPGTTRDIVECRLVLGGVPVMLADTAGLRATQDMVEQEGVRRAKGRAGEVDLVLVAFAIDQPPDEESRSLLRSGQQVLVLATKCDLATPPQSIAGHPALPTSAQTGEGIAELKSALTAFAQRQAALGDAPALTRTRHRAALTQAAAHLGEAGRARLPELAAEDYRAALNALGRLTGRVEVEQVLDLVFRDFCIGK
ncbi:tRNA uridine-5-carboxymethylaminomethyl(34) synthesis GTPase MnmE [Falsiroseomonas sp. E2-1-a4]|uniref:tRNA uridine-5-carboxymethylaminomethyl(34) synthesis GTPase MnmE n=1 Tax=Falsiroseomonas sp. E2-1-a4 TaxID=3239299 RepID=UPI003F59FE3B